MNSIAEDVGMQVNHQPPVIYVVNNCDNNNNNNSAAADQLQYWKEEAIKWESLCKQYQKESEDLRCKLEDLSIRYYELLSHSSGSSGSLGSDHSSSSASNINNNNNMNVGNKTDSSSLEKSTTTTPSKSKLNSSSNGTTQPVSIGSVKSSTSFSRESGSSSALDRIFLSKSLPDQHQIVENEKDKEKKKSKKWNNLIKFNHHSSSSNKKHHNNNNNNSSSSNSNNVSGMLSFSSSHSSPALVVSPSKSDSKKDQQHLATPDTTNESAPLFSYNERGLSSHFHHLPRLNVKPILSKSRACLKFSGPDYPAAKQANIVAGGPKTLYQVEYGNSIMAMSTSTYPYSIGSLGRDGDPIADRYNCVVFENRLVACLADGCNWGSRPKEAAQKASDAFIDYILTKNDTIQDTKQIGKILFDAFETAHYAIMKGKGDYSEAGTTTVLGGVLLEINKGDDRWAPEWEFVLASVGDCKAYLISVEGEICDITEGNRINLDPKDCGGRLGPHLEEGRPDLRNMNIFCASVNKGDIILMVTDGVYDNLDPHHLGKTQEEISHEVDLSESRWADVDLTKTHKAKSAYTTAFLESLLKNEKTPSQITHKLIDHCWTTTASSRAFMENNPGKHLPQDYVKYPGKMDHTTIICFTVGHFDIAVDEPINSSSFPMSLSPSSYLTPSLFDTPTASSFTPPSNIIHP
ncbi:hypothetical protein SAMD00019534_101770 [Acytostelium subglobosum LB1]|uniref:hypothetical protein n=1 Tax=Acytostelium subglobosum LB1 TaxID=1410327 RepID=UPI00064496E7|nr:hypothetical protein SAMD00019534_101770 [Acytostelium subglobosum LB1]GAM27002.1 hypothetical protein SAMD00019534_101770 [Acytostelium subglobosum LB1]|eukprot:XP_012749882.1 hypothetical protein SAMD00019534_101770 [Acytostelium subglobosum LB1]